MHRNVRIYLAQRIVWIINDDHLCFAAEFACQLLWIKFPISTGNDAALLTLHKKLNYHRGTARRVVSIDILPIAMQQCRNYLYDKS